MRLVASNGHVNIGRNSVRSIHPHAPKLSGTSTVKSHQKSNRWRAMKRPSAIWPQEASHRMLKPVDAFTHDPCRGSAHSAKPRRSHRRLAKVYLPAIRRMRGDPNADFGGRRLSRWRCFGRWLYRGSIGLARLAQVPMLTRRRDRKSAAVQSHGPAMPVSAESKAAFRPPNALFEIRERHKWCRSRELYPFFIRALSWPRGGRWNRIPGR